MSENLLTVKDLKTYFFTASGVSKAVDGVSFTLKKGETMGIVGESGSGKSVTASSIIRLLPPKIGRIVEGTIDFEGKDIIKLNKKELLNFRGKDIAVIFQDPMTSLDPVFKIGNQMVEMICAHQDVSKEKARKMAVEALKKVGIPQPEKRMESYPYELSGGMCQRVIIAMAVCCKPKMVIADEPTTALDVTVQAQVLELLQELQDEMDTSILLITHNLGVVWKMCDTVMVLYAGKTVEYADTKTLYAQPLHPYTWGLLDSMPKLSDTVKGELNTIPGVPPDLRLTGKCCNFYNRCPYATERCGKEVPELVEVEPGHFVACHRQNKENKLVRGEENRDE
ncbi:ATP-binding cassette domain-containing protein [Lactonifactor sp. BIOML-A3]|uniref:ABC transporter ATP-binding protein n=1 Tax=unclassified Lactonifactor TaxID=2636670 RepID=UPI0012B0D16A|nr:MULTISPECIES: ABC transporter ATP-binding protein [unclassified Lactonifactor]MSA01948.1 ATP-binding cassette domain-containing protein [Lactonifactor sp. BIOML-A5]MSA08462.1 ATP-binding cassette domain-containing protein [Lactonifactor sp. BIOML-A4]MSA12969.1 ATP-binding cassette domain-containing protein [Lactonifactor sp. BIOML-A3]MSA17529.1 ATP-binding cassette domain-containing protein [Lactonifactor sp. BIOML-A2]MSA37061.1 ATP-binding cassette domain-containing protein [Lactonifactor 